MPWNTNEAIYLSKTIIRLTDTKVLMVYIKNE